MQGKQNSSFTNQNKYSMDLWIWLTFISLREINAAWYFFFNFSEHRKHQLKYSLRKLQVFDNNINHLAMLKAENCKWTLTNDQMGEILHKQLDN